MRKKIIKDVVFSFIKRLISYKAVDAYSLFKFLYFWKILRLKEKDVLLDLGGGEAKLGKIFSNFVYSYINIDLEGRHYERQLLKAKENVNGSTNTLLIKGDAQNIPLRDHCVDKIICAELIEHVGSPKAVFSEAARVLNSGGIFLLTTPDGDFIEAYPFPLITKKEFKNWEKRVGHVKRLSYAQIERMAYESGFEIVSVHHFNGAPFGMFWWEIAYIFGHKNQKIFYWLASVFLSWILFLLDRLYSPKKGLGIWVVMRKRYTNSFN